MANQSYKSAHYHVKAATNGFEKAELHILTAISNLPKKDEESRVALKHLLTDFRKFVNTTDNAVDRLKTMTEAEPASEG